MRDKIVRVILGLLQLVFILLIVFGFIVFTSEADPMSFWGQIKLFIVGILMMGSGIAGFAIIEERGDIFLS